MEEWGVEDPQIYLEHALKTFGYDRCLYESNWFVNKAMGHQIDTSYMDINKAMIQMGASKQEMEAVFGNNAKRVYRL